MSLRGESSFGASLSSPLPIKPFLQRVERHSSTGPRDAGSQRNLFRTNCHTVLRVAAQMQSTRCREGVEPLGGIHLAGAVILGLLIGREKIETGIDGLFPIMQPGQALPERLNEQIGGHSCQTLTGVDFSDLNAAVSFMASPGFETCLSRVGQGAETIGLFLMELQEKGELFRHNE